MIILLPCYLLLILLKLIMVFKTLFRDTFKEITPKYNLKKLEKPVGTLHRIMAFR